MAQKRENSLLGRSLNEILKRKDSLLCMGLYCESDENESGEVCHGKSSRQDYKSMNFFVHNKILCEISAFPTSKIS